MNRQAFHQLLKKYVDGKCSSEEKQLIDQWYQLLDDHSLLPVTEAEMNGIEERLWKKIQKSISDQKKSSEKRIRFSTITKVAIAAILIGVIAFSVYYYFPAKKETSEFAKSTSIKGLNHIKNETSTIKKVLLEDSSIVSLQPGSAIAFPKKFAADKREVFLDGVAYFKVSKNAERPFYVYDDNIVTQVLGTSFIIKKVDNKIEVDVLTGRVAVYENNHNSKQAEKTNGVVITPNQKVTYYTTNHQFVTALVENPVPVVITNKKEKIIKFSYDDASVSQVLNDLQEQYNIQIIVENDKINQCFFTGDITEQSLYSKLDLLCQAIQANYEIRGTTIVINGKGCE
ncbi:MAG: FecR family protein [Parafilimonas sp.]